MPHSRSSPPRNALPGAAPATLANFAPHTEAQLGEFAGSKGKEAAHAVEETVARMLERQAQSIEGVNRGIAAGQRGELIDHEEMVKRIGRLFSRASRPWRPAQVGSLPHQEQSSEDCFTGAPRSGDAAR